MSNITKTSADISWKTDEKSDSQVEYRASPGKFSPLDTAMVIKHLVCLTDLTPGTSYYFKVMSKDGAGNLAVSLAFLVQTWAQSLLSPTHAAVIMTMEPVFAGIFAVVIGGEHLTWRIIGGAACVLTAMFIVQLKSALHGK